MLRPRLSLVLLLLLVVAGESRAQTESPCDSHELRSDEVKQALRRWRGLAAFNRWRLVEVTPGDCVVEGVVDASMVLAPPASWSRTHRPYRLQTRLRLDVASGYPLDRKDRQYRKLATSVRRFIHHIEAQEDVRRFAERYPLASADVSGENGSGQLQVTLVAGTRPGDPVDKIPRLVFTEAPPGGVSAYQLPRMDGLPARRELLRLIEVLSRTHPHCRPSWISAAWKNQPAPQLGPGQDQTAASVPRAGLWEIDLDLEGDSCPASFRATVADDLTAVQIRTPNTVATDPGPG